MAGSNIQIKAGITVDDAKVRQMLQRLQAEGQTADVMNRIGEALQESTEKRFNTQTRPDGQKWQSLNPVYQKIKHRNKDKILTLRGHLRQSIRYQVQGADTVSIGTNMEYAAIHQLGGEISMPGRPRTIRHRLTASGSLLRQKDRPNLAVFAGKRHKRYRETTVMSAAYKITMPARPFLGVSEQDNTRINRIIRNWITSRANGHSNGQ